MTCIALLIVNHEELVQELESFSTEVRNWYWPDDIRICNLKLTIEPEKPLKISKPDPFDMDRLFGWK